MTLEQAITNFMDHHDDKRKLICDGHYSKYDGSHTDGAFDEIVKALLSGHIEVRQGDSIIRSIKPTCVEIYYHEEDLNQLPLDSDKYIREIEESLKYMYAPENKIPQNHLVHDFIVYHRNRPFKEERVPVFPTPGILNNHQSGIDIAFEFHPEEKICNRDIFVRASALIRGFVATNGKLPSTDKQRELKIEDRSTYIYDELYPFTPITGQGMKILWVDNELANDLEINAIPRKNVFEYQMDDTWTKEIPKAPSKRRKSLDYAVKIEKDKTKSGKPIYMQDERPLRFYNTNFYQKGEPK